MMLILITNIITFSDIYDNQPLIGFNVPTTVLIFITQLNLVISIDNLIVLNSSELQSLLTLTTCFWWIRRTGLNGFASTIVA